MATQIKLTRIGDGKYTVPGSRFYIMRNDEAGSPWQIMQRAQGDESEQWCQSYATLSDARIDFALTIAEEAK